MKVIARIFIRIVSATALLGTLLSFPTYAQESPQENFQENPQKNEFAQVKNQIERKQFKEAVVTTSTLLQSNPQSATAYFLRGFAHIGLKDVDSAIADLEKSASILDSQNRSEKAKEIRQIIGELQTSKL